MDIFVSKLDAGGDFVYAKTMGGTSFESGTGIAVDSSGNVYTTGRFFGEEDFDPGPDTQSRTSVGSTNMFVSKLDASGSFVYAQTMGSPGQCEAYGIAVDGSGNVYTTGHFYGTADFDPGSGTQNRTAVGGSDVFVSKLDAAGGFVYAQVIGGSSSESAAGIAVDAAGNVYTTGRFEGTADFDPGAGMQNRPARVHGCFRLETRRQRQLRVRPDRGRFDRRPGKRDCVGRQRQRLRNGSLSGTADFDPGAGNQPRTSAGSDDVFVSKLDVSGNFVDARTMGGPHVDQANGVSVDAGGNVYTTGYFNGTADFDASSGTQSRTSAGANDIFVSKLDAAGNYVFASTAGSVPFSAGGGAYAIATDAAGNVYVGGSFYGAVDFDNGGPTPPLTSPGGSAAFVAKYTADGSLLWARHWAGTSSTSVTGLAIDIIGNAYATGTFAGTVDFDPGSGAHSRTSVGSNDVFVSKLDSNGNFVYAQMIGGSSSDYATGIAVDAVGNVYGTGHFQGTADFDPGPGTDYRSSAGGSDIYIFKLDANGQLVYARTMGSYDYDVGTAIAVDSAGNVHATGYFSGTVDFDPGVGIQSRTSAGSNDIFVLKLDANGDLIHARTMGGYTNDVGNDIAVDADGNAYATGSFYATVDFDPGPGVQSRTQRRKQRCLRVKTRRQRAIRLRPTAGRFEHRHWSQHRD